ncbi:MAG: hypothetical protein JNM27_18465 [Leptospirales bacterium]|nr:hypothetical protein [Leptospirales bacterium]
MDTVFLLGAGASIGHSKPAGNHALPSIFEFFAKAKLLNLRGTDPRIKRIEQYAKRILGKSIWNKRSHINLEELLTLLAIEIQLRELPELLEIREAIVEIVQFVISELQRKILTTTTTDYQSFSRALEDSDTVVTFNWDTLLDACLEAENKNQFRLFHDKLSAYGEQIMRMSGIRFAGPYHVLPVHGGPGYYLKLHGSVNWYYCTNSQCRIHNRVFPLPLTDYVQYCGECNEQMSILLIPPVLNKEYRRYPLIRRLWTLAADAMSHASSLVVWGYSLPPTDFQSNWLFTKARSKHLRTITLINPAIVNQSHTKLNAGFVRRFYDIFRDILPKTSLTLYATYDDYQNGLNIFTKFGIHPKQIKNV